MSRLVVGFLTMLFGVAHAASTPAVLKHVVDDTFLRVTADGEEREQLVFQRDEKGEISGFLRHSQITKRLN